MNIFKYMTVAAGIVALTACTTMDQYPEDSMAPDTFLFGEVDCNQYTNQFYTLMPTASANAFTWYGEHGELVVYNLPQEEIMGTRPLPQKSSTVGWSWGTLRDINYFLVHSHQIQKDDIRNHYEGVAYFFRAYFYYNMLTKFGEVPVYEQPLAAEDKELLCKPRDNRDVVINFILDDCDRAYDCLIKSLGTKKDATQICAWTALALKSRAALFEGTFRKYHDGDPFNPNHLPWEDLLKTCADASKTLIQKGGYKLYSTGTTPYQDVFASTEANADEYIWARIAGPSAAGALHNANEQSWARNVSFTKRFVAMYLNADGTRWTDNPNWKTMSYVDEFKNRDPRMAQTVLAPGYKRAGTTAVAPMDVKNSKGCYQYIKYVTAKDKDQDTYNKCRSALPIFRIAEVYLNYAEALAELGTLTQTDLNISVNVIRKRAKMPNLNMATANANPDPHMMSEEWGYPNVTKSPMTGVILEIRRERLLEMVMEVTHYNDILRWKEGKVYEKPNYGIYFANVGSYDLTGDGKNNLNIYEDKKPTVTGVSTYLKLNADIFLANGTSGFAIRNNEPGMARHWDENKDYLYGIPTSQRALSGGALTQNPGWNDGMTF